MKNTHIAQCLAGAASLVFLSFTASAQEFDPAKMEEAMKKYGVPGEEHKVLKSWTGTWKATSTYWMLPGASPMTSTGQAKCRLILGGRFLSEQFSAKSEEFGKFQGQGTIGYDRLAKEYALTWIDTMGTGMMIGRGKGSENGDFIEIKADYKDPISMQDHKYRLVYQAGDGKSRKLEMYLTAPGQEEFKSMEVIYTKAAGAKPDKHAKAQPKAKGERKKKAQESPEKPE